MADRPDRSARDKTQPIPEATRPELFSWLEKLFDGNESKPERIELRQAYGPGLRHYAKTIILQKEWKANAAKPSKEQLVFLSNELLDAAQMNCNVIGKSHRYGILAKHYVKSDDYYAAHMLALQPTRASGDYDPSQEEEDENPDGRRRDKWMGYTMDVLKEQNEHRRWEMEQSTTTIGQLMQRLETMNDKLTARVEHLEGRYFDFFKLGEEALSKKQERDQAAEAHKFKLDMWRHGGLMLKQMLPVVVNKLEGKKVMETNDSPESMAVKGFLDGLDEPQARALFGDFDKGVYCGILTQQQTEVFIGLAQCKEPPSAIDKLFGGECAITQEQMGQVQQVLRPDQLSPLYAFIVDRQKSQMPPETSTTTPNN